MSKKSPMAHRRRGFTLVEMLVTLGIVGVVGGLALGVAMSARARARATSCLANQREISQAMVANYEDHGQFPTDGPGCNLAMQLEDYIPWPENSRGVALPDVWRCPNDRSDALTNSYEPYYVQRPELPDGRYFVLGCPRHENVDKGCINVHGASEIHLATAGEVRINDTTVTADAPLEERTARSGSMQFADGSTAQLTPESDDFGVSVVASFRQEDGTLYTVVRVSGKGDTDFKVTKGSRFEVVTPVAIIGVRGTQFTVRNETAYTRVDLHTGKVALWKHGDLPVYFYSPGAKANDATLVSDSVLVLEPGEAGEVGTPDSGKVDNSGNLDLKWQKKDSKWKLKNPNDFDVFYSFVGYDDGGEVEESGAGKVGAHNQVFISADDDTRVLRVFYTLPGLGQQVVTAEADHHSLDPHSQGGKGGKRKK